MADMVHRPLGEADSLPPTRYLNRVEFVGGPRDGQSADLETLPESIEIGSGHYRRSVRCAEDGAMRYVWVDDRDADRRS